jgi:hypothetical protein
MDKLPESKNYIRSQPKMTLAARRSGKKEDMYVYRGKFTPNKDLLGRWAELRGVNGSQESLSTWVKDWRKKGSKSVKGKGFEVKNHGRFHDGSRGNHMGKEYFWTGDMMVGMYMSQEARRMTVVTVEGVDFLLIEKGGFGSIDAASQDVRPNWHCGYKIYMRAADPRKKGQK